MKIGPYRWKPYRYDTGCPAADLSSARNQHCPTTPNPALGWAKAVYDSPVGRIESGWQYAGDAVTYTITVPCNRTAEVTLPDGRSLTLQPGTHTL